MLPNLGSVSGTPGSCDGGYYITLLGLPWVVDATFAGGPGNVNGTTRLVVRNVQWERSTGSGTLRCLYQGDVAVTLNSSGTTASLTASVPLASGSILCPNPGVLVGTVTLNSPASFVLS